mgnify:CR=1 FL=1
MPIATTFAEVIAYLKETPLQNTAYREGWNGIGQHIALQVPDENSKMTLPYFYISTVDDKLVPWLASQTDMLADDWVLTVID